MRIESLFDANEKLADLCNDFTSSYIKLYHATQECFPQRKMTHEQKAHVENLIRDLEIILFEDSMIPENNVVVLEKFMKGR